jgi:L-cysteine:1D-myo-inositol 2-amino-2-deoxy-alpha-D-glucopyranoside ligase
MKPWEEVDVPSLNSGIEIPKIYLTNSRSGAKELVPEKSMYRIYVCGITPYDATHLGHAATYLTFDLIIRLLRARRADVNYVQNITDIDDPLLERAQRDGVDWKDLAHAQINLFTNDMINLRVIPPTHYIGAVEAIPLVINTIEKLQLLNSIYSIEKDLYFMNSSVSDFGGLSHLDEEQMQKIFSERGGNPTLAGKMNPLDCLVWMAQRDGEPGWPSTFGTGRPGWHIECTAIALEYLKPDDTQAELIDIQGGGSDLIFPHHEMCRTQSRVLTGKELAASYVHAGMIGLDGEKMSKSKGNLVLVSSLVSQGADPMAIRYALMSDHYRSDRMWSNDLLNQGHLAIERLRLALSQEQVHETFTVTSEIVSALADDLNTPLVISSIDSWVNFTLAGSSGGDANAFATTLDTLLGLKF